MDKNTIEHMVGALKKLQALDDEIALLHREKTKVYNELFRIGFDRLAIQRAQWLLDRYQDRPMGKMKDPVRPNRKRKRYSGLTPEAQVELSDIYFSLAVDHV